MNNPVRESAIERHLNRTLALIGGKSVKLTVKDWPDRGVLVPAFEGAVGAVGFLEVKRPGKEPTPEQWHRIGELNAMGILAAYAASKTDVERFVGALMRQAGLGKPKTAPRPLSGRRRGTRS